MWHSHGASASRARRGPCERSRGRTRMPTYEYECAKWGEHVEAYQTFSEEPLKKHNQCDGVKCTGALHKLVSPVGIVLKGSALYRTGSRDSSRSRSKASSDSKSGSDSK